MSDNLTREQILTELGLREGSGVVRDLTDFKAERASIVEQRLAGRLNDVEEFRDAIANACCRFGETIWPSGIHEHRPARLRQEAGKTLNAPSKLQYKVHCDEIHHSFAALIEVDVQHRLEQQRHFAHSGGEPRRIEAPDMPTSSDAVQEETDDNAGIPLSRGSCSKKPATEMPHGLPSVNAPWLGQSERTFSASNNAILRWGRDRPPEGSSAHLLLGAMEYAGEEQEGDGRSGTAGEHVDVDSALAMSQGLPLRPGHQGSAEPSSSSISGPYERAASVEITGYRLVPQPWDSRRVPRLWREVDVDGMPYVELVSSDDEQPAY